MRPPVDEARLRELVAGLARAARAEVRIYLTGGASAVLEGWRASTADVDLRLEPERDALLKAIPALKERLAVNVELASPPDFIPELPGWRERSPEIFRVGKVRVHHFDFYSQALSKLERGFAQDREDVASMLAAGLVRRERLRELYDAIEPELYRYPAIDPPAFRARLDAALARR